jgi:cobalamin biosynthesis Mg chelatase CobN
MDSAGSEVGIISIYDSKTKTRRVIVIDYQAPHFTDGNTYENYIKLYKILQKYDDWDSPECQEELKRSLPNMDRAPKLTKVVDTWATEEEWNGIIAGDALKLSKSLPKRTKEDLIRLMRGSQNQNQGGSHNQNGTSLVPASQGVEGTSNTSNLSNGSVNGSGLTVSAATQTQATTSAGETPAGGNAYEVSKTTPKSEDSGMNSALIVVGVILCGGLLALGFFKTSLFGFLK